MAAPAISAPLPGAPPAPDIPRVVFAVLFIGGLTAFSFWILRPFLFALLWATTIVVATWPVMLVVQAKLWNRRWLAVVTMTGLLVLVFLVPLTIGLSAIVTHAEAITARARSLMTLDIPDLPGWIERIPFLGQRIAVAWNEVKAAGRESLAADVKPYVGGVARWFAASIGSVGALFVQVLLTVIVTAILYASGETAAGGVRRFAYRLAGARGEAAVRLAAQAIRGVALGVVVTAIVQAAATGLGLLVAGVPFAAILTAVTFMLCLAQIGPVLVLVPAVTWLYMTGNSGWGTFLAVWTVVLLPMDNVLRPMLIKRGANLPLLLVFAGVVGGLISFGMVGIFIGPVVLAVAFNLMSAWIESGPPLRDADGPAIP
jgi:predicted PurR-regulated permease PerM